MTAGTVLSVASEAFPLAKTGGLGDVSAALCQYLHGQGHDVRVFLPWYRDLNREGLTMEPSPLMEGLQLSIGPHHYEYRVLVGTPSGTQQRVHFIDCPALYDRDGLYGQADDHRRFLLLTRAAFEVARIQADSDVEIVFAGLAAALGAAALSAAGLGAAATAGLGLKSNSIFSPPRGL